MAQITVVTVFREGAQSEATEDTIIACVAGVLSSVQKRALLERLDLVDDPEEPHVDHIGFQVIDVLDADDLLNLAQFKRAFPG